MPNIAILVGNTEYKSLSPLSCCRQDVTAIKELLEATEKYETIEVIENADANTLKARVRATVENAKVPSELFFYYSGHGFAYEEEPFLCATDFDSSRPNETGLSKEDLHTLLRLADAELVTKVIDACNSGTRLVKADMGFSAQSKQGFRNLIQISSCLDSQSSLTGNPLSLFTQKFRNAALSKTEGVIYYTDLIAALRDQFIDNDSQTPFFVSQCTGREQFADDAHKLDRLRTLVRAPVFSASTELVFSDAAILVTPPTLAEMLEAAEAKLATREVMTTFVAGFFDNLKARLLEVDLSELFATEFTEHSDFRETTTERFIVDVLSREMRPDNFVTAEISRKKRRMNPLLGYAYQMAIAGLYDDDQYVETYDLQLNCQMARTQLRVTLTPKFSTLQRIVLVVTCAPSLEACYVFEIATRHLLQDFGKYDDDGVKAVQRWYKFDWKESTDGVVRKITESLFKIVHDHVEGATKRLAGGN